jgi:hypothetical protein
MMPPLGCVMLAITEVSFTELSHHTHGLQVEEGNMWEQSTNAWANWWYWTGLSWSCSIIYLSASTNYYILPTRQRSWKCWHICTAGNGHLPGAKHACSIDLGKSKREARAEQLPNMQESVLSAPSLQFSSYHLRIQIEPRFRAISINGWLRKKPGRRRHWWQIWPPGARSIGEGTGHRLKSTDRRVIYLHGREREKELTGLGLVAGIWLQKALSGLRTEVVSS